MINEKKIESDQEKLKIESWVREEYKNKAKRIEILDRANILYLAWECDPKIWLVQVDEEVIALGTDHGTACVIISRQYLDRKISEYSELIRIYVDWMTKITKR